MIIKMPGRSAVHRLINSSSLQPHHVVTQQEILSALQPFPPRTVQQQNISLCGVREQDANTYTVSAGILALEHIPQCIPLNRLEKITSKEQKLKK